MVNIDDWMCSHLFQWPYFRDTFISNISKSNTKLFAFIETNRDRFRVPVPNQRSKPNGLCYTRSQQINAFGPLQITDWKIKSSAEKEELEEEEGKGEKKN